MKSIRQAWWCVLIFSSVACAAELPPSGSLPPKDYAAIDAEIARVVTELEKRQDELKNLILARAKMPVNEKSRNLYFDLMEKFLVPLGTYAQAGLIVHLNLGTAGDFFQNEAQRKRMIWVLRNEHDITSPLLNAQYGKIVDDPKLLGTATVAAGEDPMTDEILLKNARELRKLVLVLGMLNRAGP